MNLIDQKQGDNLFPYIEPTISFEIKDINEIKKYDKTGIYVLWDKNCYIKGEDRFKYDFNDFPLYIGKAKNIGERVYKHIKGKTHILPISIYIYGIDFYDIEELLENNEELKKLMIIITLKFLGSLIC